MSSPAPGWYPDSTNVLRWWNGVQWSDATAPAVPVAPAAPLGAVPIPGVPAGTPVYTRWTWWIVLLPMVILVPLIGYLVDLGNRMSAMITQIASSVGPDGTVDPSLTQGWIDRQMALIFNPWYLVLILVGWGVAAVVIWFSYLDYRDLGRLGYAKPFHWAWAFLSTPLVYVIGRSVVVRRRSGRGLAPMWVYIAYQVVLFVATMAWTIWFTTDLMQHMLAVIPTSMS